MGGRVASEPGVSALQTCGVRPHLVVHAPAAVGELEPALGHQAPRECPALGRELAPPTLEEGLLDVGEGARGVALEARDDRVDDVADARVLDRVVRAGEVLVDRFLCIERGWYDSHL